MSLLSTVARWVPDKAARYVPFLARARPTLPRDETLALRPVRNSLIRWERKEPEAEEQETEGPGPVVLTVPRREEGLLSGLLSRLFQVPATRTIDLDEFGSEIWEMCDGAHSVEALVAHTCDKYKLNRRQGEVSVMTFMKMLAQRHLVGFLTGGKGSPNVHSTAQQQSKPPAKRQRRPGGARGRRH